MSVRTEGYQRRTRCVCGYEHAGPIDGCAAPRTMNLPEGKTCGDCHFIRKCAAIFGHIPADQVCDFFPVRFLEAPAAVRP